MINKVILIGNLGKDPEIHSFDGGGKVCRRIFPNLKNETVF